MPPSISTRARLKLYLRLVLGAGLIGVAFGYYRQLLGELEMTPFLVFAFAVRGMIIGAFIWAFELFYVMGPRGNRLARLTPGARFAVRIAVYIVLFETGYVIGAAIFTPQDVADLFFTAGKD